MSSASSAPRLAMKQPLWNRLGRFRRNGEAFPTAGQGPEDFSLVGIKVRRPVPSTWSCSLS
jgi:hypothetical protein